MPLSPVIRSFRGHKPNSLVWSVGFSSGGRHAISGGSDGTARLWDVETGEELKCLECDGVVLSVAISPDGQSALIANRKRVLLWDVENNKTEHAWEVHAFPVNDVAISPDGSLGISASHDQTAKVWDLRAGKEICDFKGHKGSVMCVEFSSDGKRAVSGSDHSDQTLRIWDVQSTEELQQLDESSTIRSVAISADDRFVLCGKDDGNVSYWQLEAGKKICSLDGGTNPVYSVVFSTDGRRAIAGCRDGTVRVWELESGNETWRYTTDRVSVLSVDVSQDGSRALCGLYDATFCLLNLEGLS